MPFQAIPNGVKIEFNATQNTVPIVNIYHCTLAASPTDADLEDIAQASIDWWRDDVQGGLHQSYVLNTVITTDMSVENGHQHVENLVADNTGAVATAAAAANAALCLSWRTANTGRSFRGRTYFGGLPQAAFTNAQTLDSSYVSGFVTAGFNLIAALEAVGATLVVVSRIANGVARITALATEIISIIGDTKGDSQRRRTAN
jgi:hypothetical protein